MEVIINEDGRTCNVCGKFKSWDNFYKNRCTKTGYVSKCKDCHNPNRRKYKFKIIIDDVGRTCTSCGKYKKWNMFNNMKRQVSGKNPVCRECTKKRKKEYHHSPAVYSSHAYKLINVVEQPRETKNGLLEVRCANSDCRQYFVPSTLQVLARIKALNGKTAGEANLYCSDECKYTCSTFKQRKTPKGFKKSRKRECLPEIRKMVLERDNYTCQYCHNKFDEKDLEAHHENPVACSPMGQADICDIKTACKWCHKDKHKEGTGMGYGELAKTALINEEIIETLKGATP